MPSLSRGTLTQPETWGKAPVVVFYGLFFYSVQKLGSFVVVVLFFCTFSLQNMKYPTLMHWLASWVNSTSKTIFHSPSTTSQVPPVQFSLDSVALNFRPIWCHGPSLKHCVPPMTSSLACDHQPTATPPCSLLPEVTIERNICTADRDCGVKSLSIVTAALFGKRGNG